MHRHHLLIALLLIQLTGCDQANQLLGIEDLAKKEERLEADGRAVGGGCRQSGRAIEDCYAIYSWLPRSAVYAGWRDMDTYMRENKIETIEPQLPPVEPPGTRKRRAVDEDEDEKPAKKPASKTKAKTAAAAETAVEKTESTVKATENPTTTTTTTTTSKPATAPQQPTAKVKSTP